MILIIDYGISNLRSVINALNYIGAESKVVSKPEELSEGSHLILPGVGSFRLAMERIRANHLEEAIQEQAAAGRPILGICLGMQLLGRSSTEDGLTEGLGLVANDITRFDKVYEGRKIKIPHVGFNSVQPQSEMSLFKDIEPDSDFYFTHSFKMMPDDNSASYAMTHYGLDFVSAFEKDNICATQFHPEKSQQNGIQLLKNFLKNYD